MKKIFIILFAIFLSGCVAERKGEPVVDEKEIPKCTELIKAAAKNLEEIGVDQAKVQTWARINLALRIQPCNLCQRVVNAIYVLRDEKGIYKPAMIKLMQEIEKTEPNAAGPTAKQKKDLDDTLKKKNDADRNAEAKSYLQAVEQLQAFMNDELRIPREETRNFILDNYFIPLMTKSTEKE